MTSAAFVIPFRDRGTDWRRSANLATSKAYVESLNLGSVYVVDDGRAGAAQFNRSAAYNRGVIAANADVIVFYESDLIVPRQQLVDGIRLATGGLGLVVPFSRFMALEEHDSERVRAGALDAAEARAEQVRGDRKSIGAVNICSDETLCAVGQWDEQFEGAWYDDDSMEIAFRICAGATRFVDGPAFHLYHLPGAQGAHVTYADKAATDRNRQRWQMYRHARTPEHVRTLTAGGR